MMYYIIFCVSVGFYFYCSITVFPIFPPLRSPALPTHHLPHSILPRPLSLSMGPFCVFLNLTFPLPSPLSTPPQPPLWSLCDCSLFQCLWFYFACLFVLLIRFHL